MTDENHRREARAETRTAPTRRRLLATVGSAAGAVLAGCLGGSRGDADDSAGQTATGATDSGAEPGSASGGRTVARSDSGPTTAGSGDSTPGTASGGGIEGRTAAASDWRTIEMSAVRADETFTVESFDVPVVLETFAVWCPRCTTQQQELATVDRRVGDDAVLVSLNTDPNEDASKVRAHAESHGFDWRYAVAPAELTRALVEAFGPAITNAPSTPVVVACQGGTATLSAGRTITSASAITAEVESC